MPLIPHHSSTPMFGILSIYKARQTFWRHLKEFLHMLPVPGPSLTTIQEGGKNKCLFEGDLSAKADSLVPFVTENASNMFLWSETGAVFPVFNGRRAVLVRRSYWLSGRVWSMWEMKWWIITLAKIFPMIPRRDIPQWLSYTCLSLLFLYRWTIIASLSYWTVCSVHNFVKS